MKTLELKHLAPYLPYGLQCHTGELTNCTLLGLKDDSAYYSEYKYQTEHCGDKIFTRPEMWLTIGTVHKPILRPLSVLSEVGNQMERDCNHTIWYENGAWSDSMTDDFSIDWIPKICYEWLIERHFDVFGLIDAGLAIDINTIKDQPHA